MEITLKKQTLSKNGQVNQQAIIEHLKKQVDSYISL